MTSTIRAAGDDWTQGAFTLVVSPITLSSGRTLADWASFTLTVRADPRWPRTGADAAAKAIANLDPDADGWAVAATITGTVVGSTLEFDVPADTVAAGVNRYSYDVYGVGGTAGNSPLVVATWVNVVAKVY